MSDCYWGPCRGIPRDTYTPQYWKQLRRPPPAPRVTAKGKEVAKKKAPKQTAAPSARPPSAQATLARSGHESNGVTINNRRVVVECF